VALIVMLAGIVALVGAAQSPSARARVVGGNLPVDAAATDPLDLSARNSPAMVANPTDAANVVVANRIDLPRFTCALQVSLDGGGHWGPVKIPVPEGKIVSCFSPDAAFGADGTLYVSYTTFAQVEHLGTVPDAIWMTTSHDGGRTLSAPVQAAGPSVFHVRMATDPATPHRLYLAWLKAAETLPYGLATPGNPIVISRSDDDGATWTAPTTVSAPDRQRVVAPALAVAKGNLYVSYLDVGDDALDYSGAHEARGGDPYPGKWSLVVARSRDGGNHWSESVLDKNLVPIGRFVMLFPPAPSLALDRRSGRVYVAFHDGRSGDADVAMWSSGDGSRWSAPKRINDTALHDHRSQYLPALAVAPGGRVDLLYYDRRADHEDVANDVSLQSSFDGGRTFTHHVRLTDHSFDSRIGFGHSKGLVDLGDRLALVSTKTGVLAAWADTRAGNEISGKQDITRELVAISGPSGARGPLGLAGRVLLVAGAVILIAALVSGKRRSRDGA